MRITTTIPTTIMPMATGDHHAMARTTHTNTLRLDHVSKSYRMGQSDVPALRDVTLEIPPGQLAVILGEQRGGRSTLLNIMGGYDIPTSGRVFFGPLELTNASESDLADFRQRYVGFVFPFNPLFANLTALNNVWMACRLSRPPLRPEDALRLAGLSDRAHLFPAQMSDAEQQLVAIARAVVKCPQLLVCDEPTGMLDHASGKTVLQVIERVHRESGVTTVIITRNPDVANAVAGRVIVMNNGRVMH